MSELENPALFRYVLESLQTGIYLVDREQRIIFWNDGAERITGYLRHDMLGRFCRHNWMAPDAGHTEMLADAMDAVSSVLRDGKPMTAQVALLHKSGHRVPVQLRAVPIRNSDGTIIGAVESFDETFAVSDWDKRRSKLASYGCLDEATGAINQGLTEGYLREKLATFGKYAVPFSVLCVQVDRIEILRAAHGPGAVTAVLRAVAQTLGKSLRPTDLLGWCCDQHFLAILGECGSNDIQKAAARLKKMVSYADVEWWGDDLTVTASFGGTAVQPGDTLESLIQRAEKSALASVEAGGNCVSVLAE